MGKIVLKKLVGIVLLAITCMHFFACQKTTAEVELVDFQDKSIQLVFGEKYTVEKYVYDTDGSRYELNALITDANGGSISASDEIIVQENYTIVYSVEIEAQERQKTVNITACSVPQIFMTDMVRECIVNMPVTLPTPTCREFVDGKEISCRKEIFYVGQSSVEKMLDYDGVSEIYTPKKLGNYCYKITATNSSGIVNVVDTYFNANTLASWDVLPSLEGVDRISTSRKEVSCAFVENKDLPDNGNYKGNAFKYENVISNAFLWIKMPYTATDILALKNEYQIKFTYFVESDNDFISNKDGLKDSMHYNLFSAANYLGDNKDIKRNEWISHTVSIEDFAKTIGNNNKGAYISTVLFALMEQNKTVNVYLGEITLQPISK